MGKRTRFSSEPFGTAIERLMTEAGTTYRGLASLTSEYEAVWMPVLQALSAQRRLRCDVKLARLLIFGALMGAAYEGMLRFKIGRAHV